MDCHLCLAQGKLCGSIRIRDKRQRILKPKEELEKLPADSSDIFLSGIIQYYSSRPDGLQWDQMCLATFASCYRVTSKESPSAIKLKSFNKWVLPRKKQACLRTPHITLDMGQSYYYHILFLFLPWRDETELIPPGISIKDFFIHSQSSLDKSSLVFQSFNSDIERCMQQIQVLQSLNELHSSSNIEHLHLDVGSQLHNASLVVHAYEDSICDSLSRSPSVSDIANVRMTDVEFQTSLQNLSNDQRKCINVIQNHFTDTTNKGSDARQPLRLFITGSGGSGKSFVIKLAAELIDRLSACGSKTVLLMAPTGIASYHIRGSTIHSALCLPIDHHSASQYLPLSPNRLKELRQRFQYISTIIIDEISMVGLRTFENIHRRLSEIKNTLNDPASYFGNLNIIAFGDLYQLKPVFDKWLFDSPPEVNIWKKLFKPMFLTSNHRQKDNTYLQMLNEVRVGILSKDSCSILQSRILSEEQLCKPPFESALRIFPKRHQCFEYNRKCLTELCTKSKQQIYEFKAEDTLVQGPTQLSSINISSLIPDDDADAGGLCKLLPLSRGCRVMLIRNIACNDGLVNGARGTVVGFDNECTSNDASKIQGVMVKFDDPKIGQIYCHTEQHEPILIKKMCVNFYGVQNAIFSRTQFPLVLCYASTVHKVQGLTLDHAVLDIGDDIFQTGQVYVALSRVRTLPGIAITAFNQKKAKASSKVHSEMHRLLSLS